MNLVTELIVAGLTGRPGPELPGQRFVFVEYDNENNIAVRVLGEGPTPALALVRGVRHAGSGFDPADLTRSPHFGSLPEEVRNSGDRDLIGFLLWAMAAPDNLFTFATQSGYLDDHMAEFLPGTRCIFAWDAAPPLHDAALGLYAFEPVAFDPDWRTDTVRAIAWQMHQQENIDALPILADALQDAGCDDELILSHCLDPAPTHDWGYCWVIHLILGQGFVSEVDPGTGPDPGR